MNHRETQEKKRARIRYLLQSGPMTVKTMEEELNFSITTSELRGLLKDSTFQHNDLPPPIYWNREERG